MKLNAIITIMLIFGSIFGYSQEWKTYPYTPSTTPTTQISFPLDEGRHATESLEWWYVSGHITTTTNKAYSFMLAYFYRPTSVFPFNFDGFRVLNVTDEETGTFYQDTKALNYNILSELGLDIEADLFLGGNEFWRNKKDGGTTIPFEYELSAASSEVSISLELVTVKRPLIVGGDGLFDQGASSYTYYYSQTENSVSGSLTVNGETEAVTGEAWIDRQYGTFNPFTGEDYEWFSIKLDNGTDLNLWNIFTPNRTIPSNAKYRIMSAYVDENQNTQYTISDFEIERLEYFFTPDNERCYSKKWRLTSSTKNIDLIITSNHQTSEVLISELGFYFFEGTTTISGSINNIPVNGVGFAELLHRYEHPEISISLPANGVFDPESPITWNLNNPDDGRPLTYDLLYSIDNKTTFNTIVEGIPETSYVWDGTPILNNENDVWFKVKAYSKDKTLNTEVISLTSLSTLSILNFDKPVLSFYPNPAKESIFININNQEEATVEIINISGQQMLYKTISKSFNQEISIQTLPNGIYFLKFSSKGVEETLKFVKK
ncbi:lipocalin-like domain-containing protein [Cognatitamlana onchidii]|uniref:lipocalin-like domain-containing protein n=1 Tax=Cognatitamlana onchidii TaxID=2562860 RepID=UPI0010A5B649|nr:lipocalin-like domain-containing protein [Algibacter onchidii]